MAISLFALPGHSQIASAQSFAVPNAYANDKRRLFSCGVHRRRRDSPRFFGVVVAILLGCSSPASLAEQVRNQEVLTTPPPKEIRVKDFLQRETVLSKPAERIVTLAPHIVENMFSAGAGHKIVGTVSYSDYPAAAKKIPLVGSYKSFSLEAIIASKPDLVIVWYSGSGGDILDKLSRLNIPAYASNPTKLEDVARAIRDFGRLADTQVVAEAAAQAFEMRLATLRQRYADATQLSALYQVWDDPIQTLNDNHIISDVLRLCGATNAFGDAIPVAPKISIESVIARNPDLIIASGMGEERPDWLDRWKRWQGLKAVQTNQLYFVPPDLIQRHTVRILDGAQMICEHLEKARSQLVKP